MLSAIFVSAISLFVYSQAGLVMAAVTTETTALAQQLPSEQLLTDDWLFYRFEPGDTYKPSAPPVSGWQPVLLPHSAKIEPRIVNDQWQGDALYKRSLFAHRAWRGKTVWLRFEGAMGVAQVYSNGEHIFAHMGGYLPFTVDLSDKLRFGEQNRLLIHLDNRDNPLTGPKPLAELDFNFYGGLYREVRLLLRDSLHITDEMLAKRVAGGGVFITYPQVTQVRADVRIKTHIANQGETPRHFNIVHTLLDGDQAVATRSSEEIQINAGSDLEHTTNIIVVSPRLWTPRAPALYQLRTQVVSKDRVIDERETQIGIRHIDVSTEGIRINGEKLFLRGVNRHQEYPYVGYALPPNADFRDAKLIKEAGFDYVRLSHYPHSRHFMRAADELGLVLLNAIPGWQYYNPDPVFNKHVLQTCRDLVRRDRNHPSVFAWECSLNESPMPQTLVEAFADIVREEYPGNQGYSAGWLPEGYDIYLQARQHRLLHPDRPIPAKPYLVSEYGDWEYYAQNAGLQQHEWQNLEEAARNSRQLLADGEIRLLQQATNVQEAHNDNLSTPAFADGYWAMFDYNRGYADDLEASGLMSLERLPKPAYYFFRSQRDADEFSTRFSGGPVIHIANEWREDSPRRVRVFSNGDEVELFLNGRSLERRSPDQDRMSWNLRHPPFTFHIERFIPGVLEAVAYLQGREIARHRVRTPGAAVSVEARLATWGITPTLNDLLFVHARIIDANATTVPVTGLRIKFRVGEGLKIIGPDSVTSENGRAAVLARVTDETGQLSVSAETLEASGRTGDYHQVAYSAARIRMTPIEAILNPVVVR